MRVRALDSALGPVAYRLPPSAYHLPPRALKPTAYLHCVLPTHVDMPGGSGLSVAVPLLCRITAVLLLALWLPATAHCRLEAAGAELGSSCCASPVSAAADDECNSDICDALEGRATDPSTAGIHVSAPVLCVGLVPNLVIPAPLAVCAPPGGSRPEESTAPPELVPSHHFVDRTALPARSPDCAS